MAQGIIGVDIPKDALDALWFSGKTAQPFNRRGAI
jgi:hypothetical protein